MNKRLVYLDHAATTPVDPRVIEAMQPYWSQVYGNTSSIHSVGRRTQSAGRSAADVATVWAVILLSGIHQLWHRER
jgi:cysteine sulfinate desulfinase/cysteine desulfurase-like protein